MSATVTRADLRISIRQDLASWPVPTFLEKGIDDKARQIELADEIDKDYCGPKCLLEVGSEVLRVVDQPEDAQAVRVHRGWAGSTAAAHNTNEPVRVHPSWGWTDLELNRLLDQAVRWLKPHAWTLQRSSTFTWAAGAREATPPAAAGISYPDGNLLLKLEHLDSDSVYKEFSGWIPQGDIVRMRDNAGQARTLRATYAKFQAILSSDASTLDNDDFAEAVVKYTVHLALNSLKSNRVRFAEYAAALNDRASTPDELIRVAFDFKNQAVLCRDEKSAPRPAGLASTWRNAP